VHPELESHGVILKFRLKENMPIYEFICEGNKAFSTLEILSSTPFLDQLGKPANQAALSSALGSLEKMYRDKGFFQAHVTEVTGPADNSLVEVDAA
jgi:outer membrane protein assembly factor BamA